MNFLSPEFLWLLLALPAIVAVYLWVLKRKKRSALRYASLELVKQAMGKGLWWRRHLPPAILFAALAGSASSSHRNSGERKLT